jgi:hypothetical protein
MRIPKSTIIVLTAALMVFGTVSLAGDHHRDFSIFDGNIFTSDEFILDIEGGSVIITHEYEDDEIEITDDYELYVNGDLVKLDARQQRMVEDFHTQVMDIKSYAIEIGKEGAKIGIEGAGIALKAVGGVIKMIFTDYDEDDLDRDLDYAAEKLEFKAELLEDKAEEIEDMAENLEDLYYDMEDEIPAIKALGW